MVAGHVGVEARVGWQRIDEWRHGRHEVGRENGWLVGVWPRLHVSMWHTCWRPLWVGSCAGCRIEFQATPTTGILLEGRRGPFMDGPPIDLLGLFGSLDALSDCMRFFGKYYIAHEQN
jgi:hypothetical protein